MDEFSDPSWKITLLLRLPPGARVALHGELAAAWGPSLAARGYRPVLGMTGQAADCDAVLHFPGREDLHRPPLRSLLGSLGDRGQFFGLFRRRLSIFRGVRGALRNLLGADAVLQYALERELRKGALDYSLWVPLPNLHDLEELAYAANTAEVAASLGRGAGKSRLFRNFSDGFGVHASRKGGNGLTALCGVLQEKLRREGVTPGDLQVARFDLRARGALVLILPASALEYDLVCRFGYAGATRQQLQRHWDRQGAVRADLQRDPAVAAYIPRGVAQFDLDEYRGWIEERVVGTVSWRLPVQLRKHVEQQLLHFLAGVGGLASAPRTASAEDGDAQLNVWAEQHSWNSAQLEEPLAASRELLSRALQTEPFHYGWAHGDFGFGNAIVAADTGDLRGIIDWETASRAAPIGIDLFNLLLQRRLASHRGSLAGAVGQLLGLIQAGSLGAEMEGLQDFLVRFLPSGRRQYVCFGLALHRWVRRELRYSVAAGWSAADLAGALRAFLGISLPFSLRNGDSNNS
jgi:hypothetical protein